MRSNLPLEQTVKNIFLQLKGIVSDSNNIYLWHESEDINTHKSYFQNFSLFQFQVYKLCMIMCIDIAPQTIVIN